MSTSKKTASANFGGAHTFFDDYVEQELINNTQSERKRFVSVECTDENHSVPVPVVDVVTAVPTQCLENCVVSNNLYGNKFLRAKIETTIAIGVFSTFGFLYIKYYNKLPQEITSACNFLIGFIGKEIIYDPIKAWSKSITITLQQENK